MASRPSTIPQLDTNKTNRTIPAASKVTDGYPLNDPLPASNVNYLHGWAGDWLEWLQERTEDGAVPATDLTLRGINALTVTGDGGDLVLKSGDGGATSGDAGNVLVELGSVVSGASGYFGVEGPSSYLWLKNTDNAAYSEVYLSTDDGGVKGSWEVGTWASSHATKPGIFYVYQDKDNAGSAVGLTRLSIAQDGSVGIGVDSPTAPLQVSSTNTYVQLETTDATTYSEVFFRTESGGTKGSWEVGTWGSSHASTPGVFYVIQHNDNSGALVNLPRLTIDQNGDVTIPGTITSGKIAATSVTTNSPGVTAVGDGSGAGVDATGSSAGSIGVKGVGGGALSGVGVYGQGSVSGNGIGVSGLGTGTEAGVKGQGGTSGIGVWGRSTSTEAAVYADSAAGSGYGVIAEADNSSPVRTALRLVPQGSDASSPQVGDVYYSSAVHKLKVYTGTGWETITSA
jgi:hypothetical protein